MEIGETIKQGKFRNEYHKLLINIIYTGNQLSLRIACLFKPYGITPEQFNVLRILRGQYPGSANVNLITERMLNKNSNASRLVEKLRLKGFVERHICCEDRRAVNVSITSKGLELLSVLDKKEEELFSELYSLPECDASKVNECLDVLRA